MPKLRNSPLLYAILDTQYVKLDELLPVCEGLLAGGADLVQFRAKDLTTEQRIHYLNDLVPLFANMDVPLIVNDDIEACLAFPNLGLHVGQDDLSPRDARKYLGNDRILGLSTHSVEQAQKAIELADVLTYSAIGPVYETPTKPDYLPVGLSLLRNVMALHSPIPRFAIGGIKMHNLPEVIAQGARNVVMVSALLTTGNPEWETNAVKNRLQELVRSAG
jgi:thiamine-phosphate pyrophosphorylase